MIMSSKTHSDARSRAVSSMQVKARDRETGEPAAAHATVPRVASPALPAITTRVRSQTAHVDLQPNANVAIQRAPPMPHVLWHMRPMPLLNYSQVTPTPATQLGRSYQQVPSTLVALQQTLQSHVPTLPQAQLQQQHQQLEALQNQLMQNQLLQAQLLHHQSQLQQQSTSLQLQAGHAHAQLSPHPPFFHGQPLAQWQTGSDVRTPTAATTPALPHMPSPLPFSQVPLPLPWFPNLPAPSHGHTSGGCLIECGIVTHGVRESTRYLPLFRREVAVFTCCADPTRTPLYKGSDLALAAGVTTARVSMFLLRHKSRSQGCEVCGIHQAERFVNRLQDVFVKRQEYFVREDVCVGYLQSRPRLRKRRSSKREPVPQN